VLCYNECVCVCCEDASTHTQKKKEKREVGYTGEKAAAADAPWAEGRQEIF
jgi:hypothetical protein